MPSRLIRLRAIDQQQDNKWESDSRLRIGRTSESKVVPKDTSINPRHAEIEYTGRMWLVRDLGSTNGTFLNGARVGRTDRPLRELDILQFGNFVMTVEVLKEDPLDYSETPCEGMQVQATTQQSL